MTVPSHAVEVVVVIPARAGSKGIPSKNLRAVGGTSLVARAVKAAREAKAVDLVVVSTDSDEIAREAKRHGADVVQRPTSLATDEASSESALLHALEELNERSISPKVLGFVQCTSPFVLGQDIDRAIAVIRAGADSVFSVCKSHRFLWRHDTTGQAIGVNHLSSHRLRRQDREIEVVETGAVYAMKADGFRKAGHRFFGRIEFVEIDALRSIEIDEPSDLILAQALAAVIEKDEWYKRLPTQIDAVVFDFDGVMTDNRVIQFVDGSEAVIADRGDGMGIAKLQAVEGLKMVVLSTEVNEVVAARCKKLGIPYAQGIKDKSRALRSWCDENALDLANLVFVGNDVNDLDCMRVAGCAVAPSDAHPHVIPDADIVLTEPGGKGAVRQLADLIATHLTEERS